jgi:glycoprotein endo-alpha-1,2-mannosidase
LIVVKKELRMIQAFRFEHSGRVPVARVSAILLALAFIAASVVSIKAQNSSPASNQAAGRRAAGDDHPVYAHLCTWFKTRQFSGRWTMWNSDYADAIHNPDNLLENGHHDIAATSYPLTDVYDTSDPTLIEYQFLLMRLSGIDGIVVDWDGRRLNPYRHEGLMAVAPYLQKYGLKLILCFEEWAGYWPKGTFPDRKAEIKAAQNEIQFMMDTFLSKPTYGVVAGKKPVIIFRKIRDQLFTPEEWDGELGPMITNHGGALIMGADPSSRLAQIADGTYFWVGGFAPNRLSTLAYCEKNYRDFLSKPRESLRTHPPLLFGSAVPAFNDTPVWGWGDGPRIAPDYQGERFRRTWELSIENRVDLVQLVTWNDWNEGTQIEPSDTYGYRYLELNKKYSAAYKGIEDRVPNTALRIPLRLYKARKDAAALADAAQKAGLSSKLDEVRDALLAGRYEQAEQRMEQCEKTRTKRDTALLPAK